MKGKRTASFPGDGQQALPWRAPSPLSPSRLAPSPRPPSRLAPSPRPPSRLAVALLSTALLAACGGSRKGAEDAAGADTPKSATPWKDKSREQRMDWMGIAVFPRMRKLFLEQDSEKYEDFSCQTCHGKRMEMVDFEMPNDLFALARENTLGEAKEYDEKTTDFMLGAVVPEMAKLLDMDAYTIESPSGFGCMGCHPTAKD